MITERIQIKVLRTLADVFIVIHLYPREVGARTPTDTEIRGRSSPLPEMVEFLDTGPCMGRADCVCQQNPGTDTLSASITRERFLVSISSQDPPGAAAALISVPLGCCALELLSFGVCSY